MLKDHLSEFEISKKLSDRKFFVVSLYQWLLSGDTAVLNPWSISTNVDRVDEVKLPCKMTKPFEVKYFPAYMFLDLMSCLPRYLDVDGYRYFLEIGSNDEDYWMRYTDYANRGVDSSLHTIMNIKNLITGVGEMICDLIDRDYVLKEWKEKYLILKGINYEHISRAD